MLDDRVLRHTPTLTRHHAPHRRLLYVACTRAQGLLYLTHATSRMVAGEQKQANVSPFIAEARRDAKVCVFAFVLRFIEADRIFVYKTRGVFSEELPALPAQDRTTICKVLGRPPPDDAEVRRRVAELYVY